MEPTEIGRRSIRLNDYEYRSPGSYFVTICATRREPLFGRLVDNNVLLSAIGIVLDACWREIPDHFPHVTLDESMIMPDHFHGILTLTDTSAEARHAVSRPQRAMDAQGARHAVPLPPPGETFARPVAGSLPTIVRSFKSAVTRAARDVTSSARQRIWQRGYHEHIVRDHAELDRIRRYIAGNPLRATRASLLRPHGA